MNVKNLLKKVRSLLEDWNFSRSFKKMRFLPSRQGTSADLFLTFFILFTLDQIIKYLFLIYLPEQASQASFLGLSLKPFSNYHWAFGLKLGMQPLFSTIAASGLFCVAAYLCVIIFYYASLPKIFNWSLTCLFAGLMSNLIDRILRGYVFDFISFQIQPYFSAHFNTSDILQTVAWIFIIYGVIIYRKSIWFFNEKRKTLIAMKKSQYEFIFYLVLVTLFISLFFIILGYQFSNHLLTIKSVEEQNMIIKLFFIYSLIILLLFIIYLGGVAIYFSNKFYGPIYAFNKYIRKLIQDENPEKLSLRKDDQLKQELEDLAEEIRKKIKK